MKLITEDKLANIRFQIQIYRAYKITINCNANYGDY